MRFSSSVPAMRQDVRCGLMSAVLIGVVALSGCLHSPNPPPPVPTNFLQTPSVAARGAAPADCDAVALADLRGQHFARLADHPMKGVLRILHPLQPITMDFSPSRLNVRVDAKGRIGEMFCG